MRLQLCIILVILRTGLKVNVMHITLHGGGGLKYGKNGIGSNGPNMFLFIHTVFIVFNLAYVCPLFLFHGTLFSFIINLSP